MYLFALFFVLYEFTTYASNDMIMPGMIQVVHHFKAPEYYVAQSLSLYILGNCVFLILAGFLAERYGKRKMILSGNLLFLFFTILILFSQNIHQFMVWRFIQGGGLAVIAIGYALIHEKFNDKAAIKLVALMANISILAPLIGPAIGSVMMSYFSWQSIFILCALLSAIAFIGLYQVTPKDNMSNNTLTFFGVLKQYGKIISKKEFYQGMACSVLIIMPLLIWIGQAPNLILFKLSLGYKQYVIYQLLSIGGLSLSSILMQYLVGKFRLYTIVRLGALLVLIGVTISLIKINMNAIVAGMFITSLGIGLANGCLWRLILSIKGHSHAMLSSALGFMQALFLALGIALLNEFISHYHFALWSFSISLFVFGLLGFLLLINYISAYKNREWN